MGISIDQEDFSRADFTAFADRLQDCLRALRKLLERDGFGEGPCTLGAELEVYIADADGRPSGIILPLLEACDDPHLAPELNRFNLEFNLTPVPAAGEPFAAMATEMRALLNRVEPEAEAMGAYLLPIGILPTLSVEQFGPEAMTPMTRYRALAKALKRERGGPFSIHINGQDPLQLQADVITLEGASTAFQVHLRVSPQHFADTFNATLLATPLVLALSGNSPYLFGHRLWEETRIALFKQSIDIREVDRFKWRQPARVSFGHGWLRNSAYEPFAETVSIYPPLLAPLSDESPLDVIRQGGTPALSELNLHMGTTWPWVRAVFDARPEGHLRIEMRALPSGPTVEDMTANAALLIGLAVGTRHRMPFALPAIPFKYAEHNFYRAAKRGLDTGLIWPTRGQMALHEASIEDIYAMMRPRADEGLAELGVSEAERRHWLGVIDERLESGMTGSGWQTRMVSRYERSMNRHEALQAMLVRYRAHNQRGLPVARWSTEP